MCFSYTDNSEKGIELILISTKSSMPSVYDVHVLVCMFGNWFQKDNLRDGHDKREHFIYKETF